MGRSDLFLKLEIIKKILGLLVLFLTMFISVRAMALSLLVTSVLSQIINSWPNSSLLDYRYIDQVMDMLPSIGLSCLMGCLIYPVKLLQLNDISTLMIRMPLGAAIYVGGSFLFKVDSFNYLTGISKGYINGKN